MAHFEQHKNNLCPFIIYFLIPPPSSNIIIIILNSILSLLFSDRVKLVNQSAIRVNFN